MEFKTIKETYRELFDNKVNELLKQGYTILGEPKALQESYKESDRVYKQVTFICFLQKP